MLGVVKDGLSGLAKQELHGVADHRDVVVEGDAERVRHVEIPRFPEDADDIGPARDELAQIGVFLRGHLRVSSRAECDDLRVLERQLTGFVEVGLVLRVGPGPSPLDIGNAEGVQGAGERQLVGKAEGDTHSLGPVAKGGVVDLDLRRHGCRARGAFLPRDGSTGESRVSPQEWAGPARPEREKARPGADLS